MEALAAASGIIGIVAFACRALSAIDGLRETLKEFSEDGTRQLFHDLDITTSILLHAKELSEQLQIQETELNLEYRAGALGIQIDDCALDLEAWLSTARRLTLKHRPFQTIFTAFTKSSRATALEKLRRHRENIDTTLSIFGRQIDVAITKRLHSLEKASDSQSSDTKDVARQISDLSSSISSSTDSIQVQNSETSRKLDTITKLLHQLLPKSNPIGTHQENDQEDDRDPEHEHHRSRLNLGPQTGHEFQLLDGVFASMTNTLRQIYTSHVSELLTAIYAWRTLEYHEVCAKLETTADVKHSNFDETKMQRETHRLRRYAIKQLFVARKTLFSEGLGETFEGVVESLKMNHLWSDENMDKVLGTHSLKPQLASYAPVDATEERKDKLTRTNEWLLGILETYEWHLHLYHSIFDGFVSRLASLAREAATKSEFADQPAFFLTRLEGLRFERDANLNGIPRPILKYWFLDAAAMLQGQGQGALSVAGLSDSDATFRPTRLDEEYDASFEDTSAEPTQLSAPLRTTDPSLTYCQIGDDVLAMEEDLSTLPEGLSEENIHLAVDVLESYRLEPSANITAHPGAHW